MATFQKVKLENICDVRDGTHDSPKPCSSGYPLVTSKHIKNRRVDLSETYLISENDFEQINKRSKVDKWDILFSMIGTVGEIACVKNDEEYAIKNVGLIKTGSERLGKYLYYYLWSPQARRDIESLLTGSTQKFINLGKLRNFPVLLPPETTQAQIVSVLSAYDDLIEINEKRIKVLEEMAQRLYTEWFVKFKFPGHEKVNIIHSDTEYGLIPEGWRVEKIGDRFCTILGGTPSRKKMEYWEKGNILWINSGAVNNLRITEGSELITKTALEESAAKMMPKRTTLLAMTGATLGQVSLTEIECCANQSVVGIYDKDGFLNEYIYLRIKNEVQSIVNLAGGGAQQHINKEIVNNKEVLLPNAELACCFSDFVCPLFDEIATLIFSNGNLSKIRDHLIPQLVTGNKELK